MKRWTDRSFGDGRDPFSISIHSISLCSALAHVAHVDITGTKNKSYFC